MAMEWHPHMHHRHSLLLEFVVFTAPQLTELLAAHRTPTAEMGTNTGRSLWCRPER